MSLRGKIAARAICNLEAADEIIAIIHGDAKPVASLEYTRSVNEYHVDDVDEDRLQALGVFSDTYSVPLYTAPPPPVVSRADWEKASKILFKRTSMASLDVAMLNMKDMLEAIGFTVEREGE